VRNSVRNNICSSTKLWSRHGREIKMAVVQTMKFQRKLFM